MKLTTKLTLIAIAAFLPLTSSVFAGDKVGETDQYVIRSIRVGNAQIATIVYDQKPVASVALSVLGTSVGSKPVENVNRVATTSYDGHGQSRLLFAIPGGIN